MSKDSLLDTLSVLDKAERIYEGALTQKQAISDNWQQKLYDVADNQYRKRVWQVTGVLTLPFAYLYLTSDGGQGLSSKIGSILLFWGILWLVYKPLDKLFNIKPEYLKNYSKKHMSSNQDILIQKNKASDKVQYNLKGLKKLADAVNYPERYLYNYDPARIYDIISVGRADTFKESLNVLETDKYHAKMQQTSELTYQSARQAEMEARAAKEWAATAAFYAATNNRK